MAIIYDERGNAIRYGTGIGGETISEGRQLTQNISALNGEVFMDIQNEHFEDHLLAEWLIGIKEEELDSFVKL